jgi:hypothetical protein
MGKSKKSEAVENPVAEAVSDSVEIDMPLSGDPERCGLVQNSVWAIFIFFVVGGAVFLWHIPQETYEALPAGTGGSKIGKHADMLASNFSLSNKGGAISFTWCSMMLSNVMALPYFIVFTIFPGWAYKIHFRGGTGCGAWSMNKLTIPLNCCKKASADDEQTHQADQLSRLCGLFIGLTFGMINFFTRMGMANVGDGCMAHTAVWFIVFVFHITSIVNGAASRCYSIYQMIFSLVLCGLMLLCSTALDDMVGFSLNDKMKDIF